MSKEQKSGLIKILQSILVGACVAFLSSLFEGLAEFIKSHSTEIMAGGVTSFYHAIKTFKV